MRDHHKLEVFALADALTLRLYAATKRFPEDERYGLASQIRRAAVSVGANIVERAARPSRVEFARFLTIAYASACELQYEISLASRLGLMDAKDDAPLADLASRTCKALRSLILAVRKT
ncbi:four helix bundle protein [Povalibacter sp.]|uniref:four helix bundle protein n=1 Tax=Povalibacter sp. TaxID=1962978 RepID=UPI002F3F2F63